MSTPHWFHRDIFPGDTGTDVLAVQALLGAMKTGEMDQDTTAVVRGLQRAMKGEITGVVDHATALALGELATFGLVPEWYAAGDLAQLPRLLRCRDHQVGDALRRFQSQHHIYPTGEVDEATAIALGD